MSAKLIGYARLLSHLGRKPNFRSDAVAVQDITQECEERNDARSAGDHDDGRVPVHDAIQQ
jgi:hypothetical protein